MLRAKIAEVFGSIQGEGKYVGTPQLFIRFYGCNLRCSYCDTKLKKYSVYTVPCLAQEVIRHKVRFISFTGGEPLLQVDFLKEFILQTKKYGYRYYLDTNAILYKKLRKIISELDIISFDVKLKSASAQRAMWGVHEKFFGIAKRKEVFLKTVITSRTNFQDIIALKGFMKDKLRYTLYLQPHSAQLGSPLLKKMFYFQDYLLDHKIDVRLLPQLHYLLKIK
jgi:7-carboxy-7-deazaguanine synthase